MKTLFLGSAAAFIALTAIPASAATVTLNSVTLSAADLNFSFAVGTDGSTSGSDGLFGNLNFKLTKFQAAGAGTLVEFTYRAENASIAPAANSRMGQIGFNVTGTPGSGLTLGDGAADYFGVPGNNNGNFNGLGGRDVCLSVSNNCSGGGNAGILSGFVNSKTGTISLTYSAAQLQVTLDSFVTRWQAGEGGASASGGGTITAVPEPATWAMMIGGFGLIGAAARRRRTAVTFA
jgi:hypothetical protein